MNDFTTLYGRPPLVTVSAPGRVNLIGEHTDYNGGFVLPVPLPQMTTVDLTPRQDDRVIVQTVARDGTVQQCEYRLAEETRQGDWSDYVQGVTSLVRASGYRLQGFEARIESSVPMGSGLSSSAALEVALLRALREGFGLELDDLTIAKLGQQVENQFVGANVGIMDQVASSIGKPDMALFLDTRDLTWRHIPIPAAIELTVIHSGVTHSNVGGHYSQRRAQCTEACQRLGISELRELTAADLHRIDSLPDPLNRRARHVITENDRVLAMVAAMERNDAPTMGRLCHESHRSMRDDFETTVPEVDLLVDLLRFEPSVFGARMTGGGFGGSVVALAERGRGHLVAKKVMRRYAEQSGRQPVLILPQ
ncbi:MAG: galactokinase [Candidatus Sericytochromatia bacterium]|nr:galactokinase [Candidatus Sericytochromatia bacterium]